MLYPSIGLSVSVYPSLTRVDLLDQSKMAKVRVTQFSAYYPSSFCLVSFIQKFRRVPWSGGQISKGCGKQAIVDIGF